MSVTLPAVASDGLFARQNGRYARQKIDFLKYYLPIALDVTRRMPGRHFFDVFAGPGLNIAAEGRDEFAGSSLVAARAVGHTSKRRFFTVDAFNIHARSQHALATRFGWERGGHRCHSRLGDGVAGTLRLLEEVHEGAYTMLCLDIEKPADLSWKQVVALHRAAPAATDAYILLPVGMGLQRQIAYDDTFIETMAPSLTAFYGDDSWRYAAEHRHSDSRHRKQLVKADLIDAYVARLRTLWPRTETMMRVCRRKNQMLYYMILATRHPIATEIGDYAARRADPLEQPRLL